MLQGKLESDLMETNELLKPYVVKELEAEVSLEGKDRTTCSSDMIEYVQRMVWEHNEDYKAMARNEKNYYQDTRKQIKKKVELYKRCHPEVYAAFIASLLAQMSTRCPNEEINLNCFSN
ncbi:nucleolar protein 16-like [Xyrauchen texanus]|uniref:nucleolar protein 16-like n=1 Tax=Xyrauchen texanus TaxID=154827 RepID=UPI002242BCDB|nr:nucleolar protein 16-like [Xyrauchen texanus]